MRYLKFIEDHMQRMAEDLSAALGLDITIADENLLRVAGTGKFLQHLKENSPANSIFARVLENCEPVINVKSHMPHCIGCVKYQNCEEVGNIAAPIALDGEAIGVISFAAFSKDQKELMEQKADTLLKTLTHLADSIAKDVSNLKMLNRLNIGHANINELINSIDKGIIIVDSGGEITHINSTALRTLHIDLLHRPVVGRPIGELLGPLTLSDSHGQDIYSDWAVDGNRLRIAYRAQEVMLNREKVSTLISFDEQKRVTQIATRFKHGERRSFDAIIGESDEIKRVIELAKIASITSSSVLITGESGTGKELLVKSIHAYSPRRDCPLIAVNCSAIPENLVESELFGYERGAFTGADPKGKPGKFEQANGGILFLDEIGDLPLYVQPKLLRSLQEKEVTRIGSSNPLQLDIKVVVATHKNLLEMVQQGTFREDLYYRLNVIPLHLPPLRERGGDIQLCASHFIAKICERLEIPAKTLDHRAERLLRTYRWPGNLREMENVLEFAVNFAAEPQIQVSDFPPYLLAEQSVQDNPELLKGVRKDLLASATQPKTLQQMTEEFERMVIRHYQERYGDSTEDKKRLAQALGVSLTTLYRKQ